MLGREDAKTPCFTPGQRITATLQNVNQDQTVQGRVNGRNVILSLPQSVKAGDTLELIVSEVTPKAVFANTAVDRIVPAQAADAGLDVTVETYFEWAIESPPFGSNPPEIPDATWVPDLEPYIERKLFTVNTGHATSAWFGFTAGIEKISDALADPAIAAKVEATLEETSALLEAVHGLDATELADYRATILRRFANPALPDTVERVGRQPLRKLSRNERFVSPAASAAERGLPTAALVAAMGAALAFDVPSDEQSVELQQRLRDEDAAAFTTSVTGLDAGHPLSAAVEDVVRARQGELG